jgi:hypothetical protein
VGTAVRSPKNHREAVPQPQNGGKRPPNRPGFAPFERLGHLGPHPGAQLRRCRRSQHVPAGNFVKEHTEDTPATTDAQPSQPKTILQTAVGRLLFPAIMPPLSQSTSVPCQRFRSRGKGPNDARTIRERVGVALWEYGSPDHVRPPPQPDSSRPPGSPLGARSRSG